MDLLSLKTALQQQLKLSPQLLQSMEMLQMNSQELLDFLSRAAEENPLLEQEDSPDRRAAYAELCRKAPWLDSTPSGGGEAPEAGAWDHTADSLSAFLRDQLERRHLAPPLLALCKYLAELVDEEGYLTPADLESVRELHIPEELTDRALKTLQSLDPAGVAARSLEECLLLQLQRLSPRQPLAEAVAQQFLSLLGKKQYQRIARELRVSPEEVQAAEAVIQKLEPHPGRAFQPAEPTLYVRPDLYIVELDGELKAVLNEYYLPRFSVSSYYVRLLRESVEQTNRDYLRQKLQQAQSILAGLRRRGATLQSCADAVLETQRNFFTGKDRQLQPMTLFSLAEKLQVHPSTVSRAVQGKYLQCRQGTFPLRYFFSHAVAGGLSEQAVKLRLARLVRDETSPLSDQKLCDLLRDEGIPVARRTVAKYRGELNIPSSSIRRRR